MIKSVDFEQENSIFQIKEKDKFPLTVDPGENFEFTVLVNRDIRTTSTDSVKLEITDPSGNYPSYKYIKITYNDDLVTPVTNNISFELTKEKIDGVDLLDSRGRVLNTFRVNSLSELKSFINDFSSGVHLIRIRSKSVISFKKLLINK